MMDLFLIVESYTTFVKLRSEQKYSKKRVDLLLLQHLEEQKQNQKNYLSHRVALLAPMCVATVCEWVCMC